ncbi:MAG: DUF448 domain-containing protein [Myxococcales bacterium]|nr:DUF448 domain-containing protein [Myxococcales bacterium]
MPPVRTCVVSRERADPDDLVRLFAGPDGVAHVDWHARWKGRGAWVRCDRRSFDELVRKPGILQRALDVTTIDTAGLLEEARAANTVAVAELLSLSARAGALVSGADALSGTSPDSLCGMVLASDAAAGSIDALVRAFPDLPRFRVMLPREALGHRVGKGPRAAVGLRNAAPTRALLRELRRMLDLG